FRAGGGASDEAGDVRAVRPRPRRRHGRDTSRDTRARRDRAQHERRRGARQADSVDPGRRFDRHAHIGVSKARTLWINALYPSAGPAHLGFRHVALPGYSQHRGRHADPRPPGAIAPPSRSRRPFVSSSVFASFGGPTGPPHLAPSREQVRCDRGRPVERGSPEESNMTTSSRTTTVERPWALHVERPSPEVARLDLTGAWRKEDRLPDPSEVWREIEVDPPVRRLTFDTSRVTNWDSGLVTFAKKVLDEARTRVIDGDRAGLPDGV